ncbi:hypothetical protein GCM10010329_32620 [Streptomyces spiroverticillatus]|uniref:Uncharacterized protein n=1 Tax=Streptomyces finlayi TaxID=67296 RepID=A0A918WWD2_9ACTN|nr:hypothetical protein GCM10010329_32620 [Streptomyces spiroverticillatus]GHC90767.1 hypothetical protein GCM10010334_25030 [Streptomyces finlayi]
MTSSPAQQPFRDRDRPALGRGVSTLIPSGPGTVVDSAADRARAALAGVRTVPVHVGVLEAAVVLLEERSRTSDDATERAAAAATVAKLREAMEGGNA